MTEFFLTQVDDLLSCEERKGSQDVQRLDCDDVFSQTKPIMLNNISDEIIFLLIHSCIFDDGNTNHYILAQINKVKMKLFIDIPYGKDIKLESQLNTKTRHIDGNKCLVCTDNVRGVFTKINENKISETEVSIRMLLVDNYIKFVYERYCKNKFGFWNSVLKNIKLLFGVKNDS